MASTSCYSVAPGSPDLQLSEGSSGAAMPYGGVNGTFAINNTAPCSEPLPNKVALTMGQGRSSSGALMNCETTMPRSSDVVARASGEALLSNTLSHLPQPMEKLHSTLPPPFLTKIYDMVEDMTTNYTVSWSSGNNSFVVWNLSEFSRSLLPRYFKHNNFSSFVRQLNTYGFRKISPDRLEFAHEAFLRGQKHLLKDIHRRKPGTHVERQQELDLSNSGAVTPSTEQFGERDNFGLKEEIERLKHDKGVLAAEVVRLQQQQQVAEHSTRAMAKHVQVAERRQELMMNFLAKAVRSPAFVAHIVQQSESRRVNYEARKRKCLPCGGDEVQTELLMDSQAPIKTLELPAFTDKEELQSLCLDKLRNFHTVQSDATPSEEVAKEDCGVTSSMISLGLGMAEDDENIPPNYDPLPEISFGPWFQPLEESTTDLDFDMQEFLQELAPSVGDDVYTNPSSSNTFCSVTSDYNLHDYEVSQIIKGISETDHSAEQQVVTSATGSYLSQNTTVKDHLEVDCMISTAEGF